MTDTSLALVPDKPDIRRTRERRSARGLDKQEIWRRVKNFYDTDTSNRTEDIANRIQRYAKYRMWTEGKDWPWADSSDAAVPDMMSHSGRLQDTIHNAVMQRRPVIGAKAIEETNNTKQRAIDQLQDYQFFVEQEGQEIIGDLAEAFINDGVFYAFVPWVREFRRINDVIEFDPIPPDVLPEDFFRTVLARQFEDAQTRPADPSDPWDWIVTAEGERSDTRVRFYTKGRRADSAIEMVIESEVVVYDGPRIIPKEYPEVLYPTRAGNLQPPSPSNPRGASHVILIDYPTVDEIKSLAKRGIYDLIDKETLDKLENLSLDGENDDENAQKDVMAGKIDWTDPKAKSHRKLTRLMCFDQFDIDGDGQDEDVIWWVLLESKTLLRAKFLTEIYPITPPRRPLVARSFFPVRNRVAGISLLEMMEGLHDLLKMTIDQTVDAGTLKNIPFGFYRASGTMKPETIRLTPGDLYPLGDPQRDINFPQMNNVDPTFGFNLVTLINQFEEKLTMQSDFNFGKVPPGAASALRTASGMSMLAGQGEARPERILRRFFSGLADIWKIMHALNQEFLPKQKAFRIMGPLSAGDNPYQTISRRDEIRGNFLFDFDANVLNTSKLALQENLEFLASVYISELSLQLGIINPDGIYRLMKDLGRSRGQDPDQYITPPSPNAARQLISAEDALLAIANGLEPDGMPMEPGGAIEHFEKLMAFKDSDDFGQLSPTQVELFSAWITLIAQQAQAQFQQQQAASAAGNLQQSLGGGQGPGAPAQGAPPSLENPAINSGELLDETLPGAGGGQQR